MDYQEPMMVLEKCIKILQADIDLTGGLLPLQAPPDWIPQSAGQYLSCDELSVLMPSDKIRCLCDVRGHGLVSNFFTFHLLSPQLRLSVAVPSGNIHRTTEEQDMERANLLCIIKLLYVILRDGEALLTKLQVSENSRLCVSCGPNFQSEFQILDGSDVIREEEDLGKLLDLFSNLSEDTPDMIRFYA